VQKLIKDSSNTQNPNTSAGRGKLFNYVSDFDKYLCDLLVGYSPLQKHPFPHSSKIARPGIPAPAVRQFSSESPGSGMLTAASV